MKVNMCKALCVPLCIGGVLILGLNRCSTIQCGSNKAQFIESYERFMEEVERVEMPATDMRWGIYDDRLETLLLECYPNFKGELSTHDREVILFMSLDYYFRRYGSHMVLALEDVENPVSVTVSEDLSAVLEQSDTLIRDMIDGRWSEMMRQFNQDMEEWRADLKASPQNHE